MDNTIGHANSTQEIKQWLLNWREEHYEAYHQFLRDFNRLSIARLGFMMRLCKAVVSNLPEETKVVYEYIKAEQGGYADGLEKPAFIKGHEAEVKDCLDGKTVLCVRMLSCESVSLLVGEPHEREDGEVVISKEKMDTYFDEMPKEKLMAMVNATHILDGNYDRNKMPEHQGDMDYAKRLLSHLYVYAMLLMPEFLTKLRNNGAKQDDGFALCLFYFIALDNGHIQFFDKLRGLMLQLPLNPLEMQTMDGLSKEVVDQSVSKSYVTKKNWKEWLATAGLEAKATVMGVLSTIRGKTGKRGDFRTLDDLLLGDEDQKEKVKALISQFVNDEDTRTIDLGYLMYVLNNLQLIGECTFTSFCKAVSAFTGQKIIHLQKAKERYNRIVTNPNVLSDEYANKFVRSSSGRSRDNNQDRDILSDSWKKTRRIAAYWGPRFEEIQ